MTCTYCGNTVPEGAKRCSVCQNLLMKAAPARRTTPAPATTGGATEMAKPSKEESGWTKRELRMAYMTAAMALLAAASCILAICAEVASEKARRHAHEARERANYAMESCHRVERHLAGRGMLQTRANGNPFHE